MSSKSEGYLHTLGLCGQLALATTVLCLLQDDS